MLESSTAATFTSDGQGWRGFGRPKPRHPAMTGSISCRFRFNNASERAEAEHLPERVPRRSPSKPCLTRWPETDPLVANFKPEQSTRAFWRRRDSTHDNNAATRLHFMGMESRTPV